VFQLAKLMEIDKLEDPQNARIMLSILKELRITARDIFNFLSKLKEIYLMKIIRSMP